MKGWCIAARPAVLRLRRRAYCLDQEAVSALLDTNRKRHACGITFKRGLNHRHDTESKACNPRRQSRQHHGNPTPCGTPKATLLRAQSALCLLRCAVCVYQLETDLHISIHFC